MKTAVISGGAGGLGRALASALQARGWRVVLMDIDVSGLEATDSRIPVQVDLTDHEALAAAAQAIIAGGPSIDLVISQIASTGGLSMIQALAQVRNVF